MKCVPEGLAGLPVPAASPGIRQRRDPEGSRLSLRAVAAQSTPEPQLRNNGRGVSANTQFFHQPLTVSTAWAPTPR